MYKFQLTITFKSSSFKNQKVSCGCSSLASITSKLLTPAICYSISTLIEPSLNYITCEESHTSAPNPHHAAVISGNEVSYTIMFYDLKFLQNLGWNGWPFETWYGYHSVSSLLDTDPCGCYFCVEKVLESKLWRNELNEIVSKISYFGTKQFRNLVLFLAHEKKSSNESDSNTSTNAEPGENIKQKKWCNKLIL